MKLDCAVRYGRVQRGQLPFMGFLFAQTFSGLSDDVTKYIKEICQLHNMDENRALKEVKEGINKGWGKKLINSPSERLEFFVKGGFKG
ncbi:hypothetical protein ACFPA1_18140 [Neobacillus sp. GCM10023253]|uniref:hypothetical protein n=1 Tax=Neobacillus sp. GCM10023253 TaxID=3252644 RepID=UPI00361D0107